MQAMDIPTHSHHPAPSRRFHSVPAFARGLVFEDLPADVVAQAQRCLLDLIGVAAAGSRTQASGLVNAYAASQMAGTDRNARLLFDGRRAGLAGAAFAGGTTIDAFDAHDGHVLTKGHAGVAVLPALLAYMDGGVCPLYRSNGAEQIYRDARALPIVGGTSEMAKYLIAAADLPTLKPNL